MAAGKGKLNKLSQFLLTLFIALGERVKVEERAVYSRRLSVGKTQTMLLSLGGNPQTSPLYIHVGKDLRDPIRPLGLLDESL